MSRQCDRALEWQYAAMMIAWGLYLWLPMETFKQPQYALLKAIAPEVVWGAFSLALGSVRMMALYINGNIRHTPLVRCVGAGLGVIWWIVLTFLFLTGSEPPPAGATFYPVFVLFEGWAVLRSAGDIYIAGGFRQRGAARTG